MTPVLGGPCEGTTWIPFPTTIDSGMAASEWELTPVPVPVPAPAVPVALAVENPNPPIGAPAVLGLGYP